MRWFGCPAKQNPNVYGAHAVLQCRGQQAGTHHLNRSATPTHGQFQCRQCCSVLPIHGRDLTALYSWLSRLLERRSINVRTALNVVQGYMLSVIQCPTLSPHASLHYRPRDERRDTNCDTAFGSSSSSASAYSLHLPFGWSRIDIMRKRRQAAAATGI